MAKITVSRRILMCDNYKFENSNDFAMRLSDTVFGFLDDQNNSGWLENSCSHGDESESGDEDDEKKESTRNAEDHRIFWETQHKLLQDILCRSSSLESGIRCATKEAIKEAQTAGNLCVCRRPVAGGCHNCLMREICGRLRNAGFNTAVCKSKWKSSPVIPSGEHTFLDVVETPSPKKAAIRVIIELNFRAEFEVARASEEYRQLIRRLPEVFVGKVERLHGLIKILCSAAKKCMKENRMHMGPWRKHRYMQAKWLSAGERAAAAAPPLPTGCSGPVPRPRASMLTVDLVDNVSNLLRTAVEVL